MKRFTILVDMDGILCRCVEKILRIHREEAGVDATIEQIKGWHIGDYVDRGELINSYFDRPGFFRDLEPIPRAIPTMERLRHAGHDLVVLTTPSGGTSAQDKYAWLDQHLPWLGRQNVIMAKRKGLVRGDVLIDDSSSTLHEWVAAARKGGWANTALAMTIAYPWNEGVPIHVAFRAQSWKDPEEAWNSMERLITRAGEGDG